MLTSLQKQGAKNGGTLVPPNHNGGNKKMKCPDENHQGIFLS